VSGKHEQTWLPRAVRLPVETAARGRDGLELLGQQGAFAARAAASSP
jgi:hypothetical protein